MNSLGVGGKVSNPAAITQVLLKSDSRLSCFQSVYCSDESFWQEILPMKVLPLRETWWQGPWAVVLVVVFVFIFLMEHLSSKRVKFKHMVLS